MIAAVTVGISLLLLLHIVHLDKEKRKIMVVWLEIFEKFYRKEDKKWKKEKKEGEDEDVAEYNRRKEAREEEILIILFLSRTCGFSRWNVPYNVHLGATYNSCVLRPYYSININKLHQKCVNKMIFKRDFKYKIIIFRSFLVN